MNNTAQEDISRPPVEHSSCWDEEDEENLIPAQRAARAATNSIPKLKNYDTVVNEEKIGYRNEGVYIFNNGGLHLLSPFPDDYGSLPEWVEVRKEDCGHSYFENFLIDHNTFVPFPTRVWQVGKTSHDDKKCLDITTPHGPYTKEPFVTELHREDGAKALVRCDVMMSAPWLGGPERDVSHNGGGGSDSGFYIDYEYENGETIRVHQDFYAEREPSVTVPKKVIIDAEKIVNQRFRQFFESREIIYFECTGPCEFETDLPVFWKGEWSHAITTVIALQEPR